MKIWTLIKITIAQAYYRWAMSEVHPGHDDVPRIILRQRELQDAAVKLWS